MDPDDLSAERQIAEICRQDPRYAPAAYRFVQSAVGFTQQQLVESPHRGHITGQQLADGCRVMALEKFGPMARTVLAEWGITCTRDFGHIVFNLVAKRLLGVQESDKISDFDHLYDFATAFDVPFRSSGPSASLPVIDRS